MINTRLGYYGVAGGIPWSTNYLAVVSELFLFIFTTIYQRLISLFGVIHWRCITASHAVNYVSRLRQYLSSSNPSVII